MPESTTLPPYAVNPKRPSQSSPSHHSEERHEPDFHSYLNIIVKRKKIVIISILAALTIAVYVNLTQRPVYRTSIEVVLQRRETDVSAIGGNQPSSSTIYDPTFVGTQMRMFRGPLLAEKVLKKLEVPELRKTVLHNYGIRPVGKPEKDSVYSEREQRSLVGHIRSSINASLAEKGASIFSISVTGYEPATLKQLADAVAESYVELQYELPIAAFKKSFTVVSKSLGEIGEKIKTGELALQKVTKEIELLEALKIYGEKYPVVISLRSAVSSLSEKLVLTGKNFERLDINLHQDRFLVLMQPHLDLADLTQAEADLQNLKTILDQEVNTNRELYNSIFKRLQEVELTQGRGQWLDAKIIEPASVPSRPIRPNKKGNLVLALLMGTFIGVGLVYFLEYLDSSLQTLQDVKSYLKIFPLGMVPHVEKPPQDNENAFPEIETHSPRPFWNTNDIDLPLYVSEAYRLIRTNLSLGAMDRSLKALQVTSAVKGEGKTTTVTNLGISLAQAGIKTLLVDADMRRPTLHHIMQIGGNEEGLSNILTYGTPWNSLVRHSKVPNLYCLTAGVIPPNPAELLSSRKMKELLDEWKDNFDFILMDTPPVITVADSLIVASLVEGTILVMRAGFIPRHMSLHAKATLESVNGNIIGGILNGVMEHHQAGYYGYYGKYYGYYGEHDSAQSTGHRNKSKALKAAQNKPETHIPIRQQLTSLKGALSTLASALFAQLNRFRARGQFPKNEMKSGNDRP